MTKKVEKPAPQYEFVRITDFVLVPKKLLKSLDGYDLDTDLMFYHPLGKNAAADPLTLLYLIVDRTTHLPHGFVWGNIDIFARTIHINAMAVDKSVTTANGQVVEAAKDFFDDLTSDSNIRRLTMASFRPHPFEKWGFKPVEKLRFSVLDLDLGESDG